MQRSVLSLHLVAPRAVHSDPNEVIPGISQGAHVAELARDRLRPDQWVASDDAWLPSRLALWAVERGLVETVVVAELAVPGRQSLSNSTIHVDSALAAESSNYICTF